MSSMIWARSWPLGASTSTWTPDLEIWCLSSMTSYRSSETWGDMNRTCEVCVHMLLTHILVVLLQVGKLLPHSFNLSFDVHPVHVGVIYDFLQPCDVGLHGLADRHLIVKPGGVHRKKSSSLWFKTCNYATNSIHPTLFSSSLFQRSNIRQKLKTNKSNILYFEVISSKTSIVNLEDQTSIVCNAVKDLDRKKRTKSPFVRSDFRKRF